MLCLAPGAAREKPRSCRGNCCQSSSRAAGREHPWVLHGDTAPPRCGVSHRQEVLPSCKDQLCPRTAPSCTRVCALGASGVTLLWGWV